MKLIVLLTILSISTGVFTKAAYTQISCDEKKISRSEEVRRTAENSLLNASSVNVMLPSGTDLTAFYNAGKLVKISTTDNLSHSEQIFFEDGHTYVFERSGYLEGKEYFKAWYFFEDKIFCKQDMLSGKYIEPADEENKEILKALDEYLLSVQ